MGKRQEAAKKTRQKLVDAAKKLYKDKDISSISVDAIVKEAGVSKGSFYVYFKQKEDIASEIAYSQFDSVLKELEDQESNSIEKIGTFLKRSIDIIQLDGLDLCKEWMKGVVSSKETDSPGIKKYQYDLMIFEDFILKGIKKGEISDKIPVQILAETIVAQYYGCLTLWCITNGSFDLDGVIEEFIQNQLPKILN